MVARRARQENGDKVTPGEKPAAYSSSALHPRPLHPMLRPTRFRLVLAVHVALAACTLAGCASSRPSAPTTGTVVAGVPTGQWLVTARIPAFQGTRRLIDVPLVMTVSPDGQRFEATAPSAVLTDAVGGRRNLMLARLLKPSAVRGGGLIHLVDGRVAGDSVHATLVLPRLAAPSFAGRRVGDRIEGTLTWRGRPYGTLSAVPHAGTAPLRDYPAAARAIEDTLRARYYRPADLETPRWQAFFARLHDRMARVRDDGDALLTVRTLAAPLGTSHLLLDGRTSTEPAPAATRTAVAASPRALVVSEPRPGIAVLTARSFPVSLTADSVRAVFERIRASGARDLVVDLRGNGGGWFVSLAIASHLLERETPVGVELGRRWWDAHSAPPTPAEAAALPEISAYDLDGFYRTLRTAGAMRATVRPAEPRFAGRVVVLIDGRVASAAEPLADVLKATGRATLVGETTAGAVLSAVYTTLPGGWGFYFPEATYVNAAGVELEGNGVVPDVAVPSAQAMERAMAFLSAPAGAAPAGAAPATGATGG